LQNNVLAASNQGRESQHPHDLFTTSPLLWPIIAGMQTNEATLAPTTPGPSERPNRTGPEPAGPGAVVAGAEHTTKVHVSGETAVRALDDVTVGFPARQFTDIMGRSGSGKSTLVHCLAGLERCSPPSTGFRFAGSKRESSDRTAPQEAEVPPC
jgi:ABC-type glutathione transport system ATPase component